MTKQDEITAAQSVPLNTLVVAPENPRSNESVDQKQIITLANNLAHIGQLTPLVCYAENDMHYVTAGGRRLRAFNYLLGEQLVGQQFPVLVRIMDKEAAIAAGDAEQLSHVMMSDIDELRVFQRPAYKDSADADLASMIGKSTRYVAQRRKILDLPEVMIEALFAGHITVDQGMGLTYVEDEADRMECYQRAFDNPGFDGRDIRQHGIREIKQWDRCRERHFVTVEDYQAAGGRLQNDLFVDAQLVLDPGILERVAHEAVRASMPEYFPDRILVEVDGPDLYNIPQHLGIDTLSEDDREFYRSWKYADWSLKNRIESGDEEAQQIKDRLDALKEGMDENDGFAYPDELLALLEVHWQYDVYNTKGFSAKQYALPEDLEPLYAAGFLARPEASDDEGGEDSEPAQAPLSNALLQRIATVKAHALRQILSKSPDQVLAQYLSFVSFPPSSWKAPFSQTPDMSNHPGDMEDQISVSKQWGDMVTLAATGKDELIALKPAQQRLLLAYRILNCLTVHADTSVLCAKDIRAYWTPTEGFLKAYKGPQLVDMLKAVPFEDGTLWSGMVGTAAGMPKKSAMIAALANHAAQSKEWLPKGF